MMLHQWSWWKLVRRGPGPGATQARSIIESLKRCSGAALADPGSACPSVWVQCKCVLNVETASSSPNHCWRLHPSVTPRRTETSPGRYFPVEQIGTLARAPLPGPFGAA